MKNKNIFYILILLLCATLIFSACNGANTDDGKLTVAVTIAPEATFAQEVAGDLANVFTLVPPGYSPETYELTPLEMMNFKNSDIYFSIGVPCETAILPQADMTTVSLQDKVASAYEDRNLGNERDPHTWLSLKRAIVMVQTIADELAKIDPENADTYASNAESYIAEINGADVQIKAMLSQVTVKKFVVFHPAYGYFADEYGFEMYALEEEGQEASAQHMQEVIDTAKADGIKVIFYQAETDSSQARAFAEEIGGAAVMLEPLAADYTANLLRIANALKDAADL